MAVLAPTPSARASTATRVKPQFLRIVRSPYPASFLRMSRCSLGAVEIMSITVRTQSMINPLLFPPRCSLRSSLKPCSISLPNRDRNSAGKARSKARNTRSDTEALFLAILSRSSGPRSYSPGLAQKLFGSRRRDELLHALCFGGRNLESELGETVVAAPLIVERRVRPLIAFDKEAVLQHTFDQPV